MFFARQQQAAAERQRLLTARSTLLRGRLAQDAQALRTPLALIDRLRAGRAWLRRHPEVLVAASVALVVVRPRRAWRLAGRAWAGWQLWRRVQRWGSALQAAAQRR